ncbi:NfeD family protein [Halanaerobacter jeridensis]|uniref:Membrane protein implicated in regulation of membrane protease activity n=1 Tax=Halanaerobacter jeridensis TaxID=706427 RepID=A0A938XYZ4_9FIRM|nr:NfeD family protein [Halanaerobacter jeridensis]MBM7557880.1 membrane protein implicated in regulation of membrane protease activity [Halanaerobacter jeridensis]
MAFKIWLAVGMAFLVFEILSPTFFMVFFGVSAFITSIVSLFNVELIPQLFTFIILSIISLFVFRPFAKKHLMNDSKETRTNVDALVGQEALVTERIIPDKNEGRVKITGDSWMAISSTGVEIPEGEKVIITKVDGAKLYVKRKGN